MKILILIVTLLHLFAAFAGNEHCSEKPSLADALARKVAEVNTSCSKEIKEAITYKETDKKVANNLYKHLCENSNKFTASCIIMAKDANVHSEVIKYVCSHANEKSPLCILTAVSQKKSDQDIMKNCR